MHEHPILLVLTFCPKVYPDMRSDGPKERDLMDKKKASALGFFKAKVDPTVRVLRD